MTKKEEFIFCQTLSPPCRNRCFTIFVENKKKDMFFRTGLMSGIRNKEAGHQTHIWPIQKICIGVQKLLVSTNPTNP